MSTIVKGVKYYDTNDLLDLFFYNKASKGIYQLITQFASKVEPGKNLKSSKDWTKHVESFLYHMGIHQNDYLKINTKKQGFQWFVDPVIVYFVKTRSLDKSVIGREFSRMVENLSFLEEGHVYEALKRDRFYIDDEEFEFTVDDDEKEESIKNSPCYAFLLTSNSYSPDESGFKLQGVYVARGNEIFSGPLSKLIKYECGGCNQTILTESLSFASVFYKGKEVSCRECYLKMPVEEKRNWRLIGK